MSLSRSRSIRSLAQTIDWADYLQRMREGIETHGPVREGVYAVTGYEGVDAHAANLGQESHADGGIASRPSAHTGGT